VKGAKRKLAKWADGTKLACVGVVYVLRLWRYTILAIFITLLFAFVLTLVTSGSTDFKLLVSALPITDKLGVLGDVFVRIFTNLTSLDGVATLLLSLLQGVAVALLVFNFKHQHKLDGESVAGSGLAGLIAMLGLGCSACGTSLLMPIVTLIFSSGAYAVAETVGRAITVAAFLLVLYATRRLGLQVFAITTAKKRKEQHENQKR
jgi:hypothetical protein